MDELQRRPGRPRKWTSDAERMRAYRARERERTARLLDPADAPEALIENGKFVSASCSSRPSVTASGLGSSDCRVNFGPV